MPLEEVTFLLRHISAIYDELITSISKTTSKRFLFTVSSRSVTNLLENFSECADDRSTKTTVDRPLCMSAVQGITYMMLKL